MGAWRFWLSQNPLSSNRTISVSCAFKPRTYWRSKCLRSSSENKDVSLARMDIPNNFSQPNGCDIIYREGKLMPEILMEYAALN